MTDFTGTAGNDHLTGSTGPDHFDLTLGGHDTARGLGLGDAFDMGAAYDARDRLFGGDGSDALILNGNYGASAFALGAKSLNSIAEIDFLGSFSYNIVLADQNVAAHATLTIVVGGGFSNTSKIDGSAETNGSLLMHGHDGFDFLIGGAGDDFIDGAIGEDLLIAGAGTDTMYGGDGPDTLDFEGELDAHDFVHGGDGDDEIFITGDYTDRLVVAAGQWISVERLFVSGSGVEDINLDFSHSGLSGMLIEAHAAKSLTFTAKKADAAGFTVHGGQGDDDIVGSNGGDVIWGASGTDRLEGGAGGDYFEYFSAGESHGTHYDDIVGFNTSEDFVALGLASGVPSFDGTIKKGALHAASFNADVEHALGAHQLHAGGAVLFHPKGGDMSGEWFLVADDNGVAGYQANEDVIVHFVDPHGMANFSIWNFAVPW